MILKLIVTTPVFASLAKFIASDENRLNLLSEIHPGRHPTFVGGGNYQTFASILKSTPHKGALLEEQKLEVTVLVAEHYKLDPRAPEQQLPHQYIGKLFQSLSLYPRGRTYARTKAFDSAATPLEYKSSSDFLPIEHISMGEVILEKRVDGKLYVNDIPVTRRLVPKELGRGDYKREPFLQGEDKGLLLNACFYDALVADPYLIPEDWKGDTYFRGTIFQMPGGSKWVKGISWGPDKKLYLPNANVGHYNLTRDDSWEAILDR